MKQDKRRKDERIGEMYKLYQSGKSLSEVGQEYGVTRQSVHAAFSDRGWELRPLPIRKQYQEFNGNKYTENHNGYYRRTYGTRSTMHRDVWEFHNGPIPDGWDVHHKDENKANNDINNLECLPKDSHTALHQAEKVRIVCKLCGKRNRAGGYCIKHWYRIKHYGDPYMTKYGRKVN